MPQVNEISWIFLSLKLISTVLFLLIFLSYFYFSNFYYSSSMKFNFFKIVLLL